LSQEMGSFLRQRCQRAMRSRTHTLARHATRELLAPSQRAQFTDFTAPLDDRTLARFYTFSATDLELIRRRHRRASTQLGFAVQLGYARLPGRVLRVGEEAHPQIVHRNIERFL
jgi:hypothetical protein